jgi:SPP1 gp7 family putative phage head morphogenesis protein
VGSGAADSDVDYITVADEVETGDARWRGCHADVWALADDAEKQRAVTLLGKPVDLANDALKRDVAVWAKWQQEIATIAAASDSADEFGKRLAAWQRRNASDEDVAASLYRTTMQADMAGQLFVRVVEAPETLPQSMRALDDGPRPSFLSLPFEEALQAFLDRQIITPEEFRALSDDARQRAFSATRLASQGLIERAYRRLLESLQSGGTLDDFARQLREDSVTLGVTPADPGYLETVYRTNVASSYGAGRYRQIRSPAVIAARPFVEYRTSRDDRVRQSHAALDGLVFRQDDPDWSRYAPPNGYQCRCVTVVRRDPGGKRVVRASDLSAQPDPGFDAPPSVELTPTE